MAKGGSRAHAGRKRKPTEMKVVQGTFRGDRHGEETTIPAGWPEAPEHLNERELELWKLLEARCAPWVAPSDWLALNGVVSLMDRLLSIQAAMRATDDAGKPIAFKFTPSADGEANLEPKENPLFGMELKYWTGLRGYIAITGLSPADRTKVKGGGTEQEPANPLDKFINRKRG